MAKSAEMEAKLDRFGELKMKFADAKGTPKSSLAGKPGILPGYPVRIQLSNRLQGWQEER